MSLRANRIASLTLCLYLVVGCSSRRTVEAPDPGITRTGNPVISSPVPAPKVPVALPEAPSAPRDAGARTIPRQAPQPDTSDRVAALCGPEFSVSKISPDVIQVEKPGAKSHTSLFQQSITLGKLRSTLKIQGILPAENAGRSIVRDGTATIEFPPATIPRNAATVITAALGVEGVDRVRALLPQAH